ncbi:MAG: hypothetical protein L3K01_09825, partial [Thermoplasmata archaeon]|nr:hypothetical protein [Thermoplasmata archaeon]
MTDPLPRATPAAPPTDSSVRSTPPPEPRPALDSAFRQFEGNERLLRTAILSILAFVVSYAALTMLAWTSWAWTAGPAEVQNDL